MNTIIKTDDAIANDVIYHNLCRAKAKKKALPKSKPFESHSKLLLILNFSTSSKIEYSRYCAGYELYCTGYVNSTCPALLIENGANPEDLSVNYKKQLKKLIRKNISDIFFINNTRRNEPEQLVASETEKQILRKHTDEIANEGDIRSAWKPANMPTLLITFMKWVLLGHHPHFFAFDVTNVSMNECR